MTDNPKIDVNQAIIFDLDGLIIETEAVYCQIWKREFAREGLAFDMAGYQNLIGAHHVVNGYRPPRRVGCSPQQWCYSPGFAPCGGA